MKRKKYYLFFLALLGLFSVSVFAVDFKFSSQERVQIEVESFLRHSGCKTQLGKNGLVHASKDSSKMEVKVISLNSDNSQDQGVICYISTNNAASFDSLSKDLDLFGLLNNIKIEIIKTDNHSSL